MRFFHCLALVLLLQACKHPLIIVGEGDIVDLNGSGFGCTLEEFRQGDLACENEIQSDYFVNYRAVPRPGWKFSHWDGACGHTSIAPDCAFEVPGTWVQYWDANFSATPVAPLTAVFEVDSSNSLESMLRSIEPGDQSIFNVTAHIKGYRFDGLLIWQDTESIIGEVSYAGSNVTIGGKTLLVQALSDGTGAADTSFVHQTESGALINVTDGEGRTYLDTDLADYGVMWIPSPLNTTQVFTSNYQKVRPPQDLAEWDGQREVRVEGMEMVTTPAGTFNTYKVVITGTETSIFSSSSLTESDTTTLWVAPRVGIVKSHEFVETWEFGARVATLEIDSELTSFNFQLD